MRANLPLEEFSDFELLYVLEDVADDSGWASSSEIATQIGIDNKYPANCVGSRLGWLNRYGVMESESVKGETRWRLNEKGNLLLHPNRLSQGIINVLDSLDEGQRMQIIDAVAKELRGSSREAIHLSRRAWRYRVGGWRDPRFAKPD